MPTNRQPGNLILSKDGNILKNVLKQVKLFWLLIIDRRVNFLLKILPFASVIYLLVPFDLAPGVVLPFIGALDDAAVLWIGTTLFLSLCPEYIVNEHKRNLGLIFDGDFSAEPEGTVVVDGESRDATSEEEQKS